MILRSSRLEVEIADIGRVYRGSRFDWTGLITQITLDGRHTFCTSESLVPGDGTGGIGLCGEFGIFYPVGYHDAQPGEKFPKLGVGLLTRPANSVHDYSTEYELEPFPISVECNDTWITYEMSPLPCRGYEAVLRKTIRVHEAGLDIICELENVGSQVIHTNEYNHNFVAIDRHQVGPDYLLRLAKGICLRPETASPLQTYPEGVVRWKSTLKEPLLCSAPGPVEAMGSAWELIFETTGVGMREIVDFPIAHLSLWCAPHVIAPEVFVTIDLPPGKRQVWTRRYEFFTVRGTVPT